jgi:hypothetical protein
MDSDMEKFVAGRFLIVPPAGWWSLSKPSSTLDLSLRLEEDLEVRFILDDELRVDIGVLVPAIPPIPPFNLKSNLSNSMALNSEHVYFLPITYLQLQLLILQNSNLGKIKRIKRALIKKY